RAMWWVACAALAALTVHNAQSLVQVGIQGNPAATGVGPMVSLLLGYLLLLVAATMVAFPFARQDLGGIIDGVIMALGIASLVWTVAVHPTLMERGAGLAARMFELLILLVVSGIGGAIVRATAISRAARPVLVYMVLA